MQVAIRMAAPFPALLGKGVSPRTDATHGPTRCQLTYKRKRPDDESDRFLVQRRGLEPPEIDKSRWGRDVPLTEKARKALDCAYPKAGLTFGWHDDLSHIKAGKVLNGEAAKRFAGSHL